MVSLGKRFYTLLALWCGAWFMVFLGTRGSINAAIHVYTEI